MKKENRSIEELNEMYNKGYNELKYLLRLERISLEIALKNQNCHEYTEKYNEAKKKANNKRMSCFRIKARIYKIDKIYENDNNKTN